MLKSFLQSSYFQEDNDNPFLDDDEFDGEEDEQGMMTVKTAVMKTTQEVRTTCS